MAAMISDVIEPPLPLFEAGDAAACCAAVADNLLVDVTGIICSESGAGDLLGEFAAG
jgi:hypothetical protein